jgi:hypothetical protein
MTKADIDMSEWTAEGDFFYLLEQIKHPGENATRHELYCYWVDMRDLAKITLNIAVKAAMMYGEAKGKEQNND